MKKIHREVFRELRRHGFEVIGVENGRHIHVIVRHEGREHSISMPFSPVDCTSTVHAVRGVLRRILREDRREKGGAA